MTKVGGETSTPSPPSLVALVCCVNEAHLNTVYEEAMESAKYFYPTIFRAYPGKGEEDVCPVAGAPAEDEIKYNGKWTRDVGLDPTQDGFH